MSLRKFASAFVLAVLLLVGASLGYAQTTSGALVGVVHDPTGAVIPNSTVNATNEATGVVYTGQTNQDGQYRISNLPEGTYDLRTVVTGFTPSQFKGVASPPPAVETKDIVLSIGQGTTTVEVTSEANVSIDTTTAQIATTFSMKEIQALPSATIGLGVLNLSLLTPGVASSGGLGAGTGPSITGQRPRNNNFTIDGTDNNNKSVTGPLLYVPNDATSEFVLLQNVYSAQYGHSAGGQFNTLIVPGTNHIHGRVYEYFQNRNLNAVTSTQAINNRARILCRPTSSRASTSTATAVRLAGPILKDKLFLFSNFERQTTRLSRQLHRLLRAHRSRILYAQQYGLHFDDKPTYPSSRTTFPPPEPGTRWRRHLLQRQQGHQPLARPSSLRTLQAFRTPIPVGPLSFSPSELVQPLLLHQLRDYTISQHDSLRVRYVYNRADGNDTSASFPAFFRATPARYHLTSIDEVHVFTPISQQRIPPGLHPLLQPDSCSEHQLPWPQPVPRASTSTTSRQDPTSDPTRTPRSNHSAPLLSDRVAHLGQRQTHVNFGVEGRKSIAPQVFVQRLRGDYEYSTLGRFLNDISPDEVGQRNATPPGVSPTFYGDQSSIYAYANDDYRITSKLTLNLGLRYEFTSVPSSEKQQALNIAASVPGLITFGKPTPQYKNFAPRIGVAYAPDENTSIRAAFGINYDVLYDNIGTTTAPPQFQTTENVTLTAATPASSPAAAFPQTQPSLPSPSSVPPPRPTFLTRSCLTPSSGPSASSMSSTATTPAEVRYVGTRGVHLDVQTQLNVQSPVTAANQLPTNLTGGSVSSNPANTLATLQAQRQRRAVLRGSVVLCRRPHQHRSPQICPMAVRTTTAFRPSSPGAS